MPQPDPDQPVLRCRFNPNLHFPVQFDKRDDHHVATNPSGSFPETLDQGRESLAAGADALPLIQKAEGWKKDHPEDADLLFALGRLCQQQQLWGKAQSFLESALKLADNEALKVRAHRALARLFEHLGETDKAAKHYRESALAITVV